MNDDIGFLPYMVTVTSTKLIAPLLLPDLVDLSTIRVRFSGKRYPRSVTLDPGNLGLKSFVSYLSNRLTLTGTHGKHHTGTDRH